MITMDALEPDYLKDISREDCRYAMAYLIFLKEKRDDTIKSRGCCDRRIQKNTQKR